MQALLLCDLDMPRLRQNIYLLTDLELRLVTVSGA